MFLLKIQGFPGNARLWDMIQKEAEGGEKRALNGRKGDYLETRKREN